jgi:hypothetical protein
MTDCHQIIQAGLDLDRSGLLMHYGYKDGDCPWGFPGEKFSRLKMQITRSTDGVQA